MKKTYVLIIAILLFRGALSADGAGTTVFNFLKIEVGARATGMGGAFSAVADDGTAPYWNPAGLAQLNQKQITAMHLSWLEGVNYQFLSYIHPTRSAGTFGVSAYYLSMDGIPSYDAFGAKLDGALGASDAAFALSYGRKLAGLELGVNAKYIRETLADESAAGFAADAGLLYRYTISNSFFLKKWFKRDFGSEVRFALSAQNLGPGATFVEESQPLPANYRFGISQDFLNDRLTTATDVNLPSDNDLYMTTGFEYRLNDWIALRAGYRFPSSRNQYDIQPGLVGGVGLGNEYMSVDYAFVPYSAMGVTHRVGLTYRFGREHFADLISEKITRQLTLAHKQYLAGDLIDAYRLASAVLSIDPLNDEAQEFSAMIQSRINEINVDKYLARVAVYMEQDNLREANEMINTVLRLFPDHAGAARYAEKVEEAYEKQKAERAESMFKQSMEFYKDGLYPDAISLLENVLKLSPHNVRAKEQIALAQAELEKIAAKKKQEEEELRMKKADSLIVRAVTFFNASRWEKAKETFEEAADMGYRREEIAKYLDEINKRLAAERFARGKKYYEEKSLANAVKQWEEAASLTPGDKDIVLALDKARGELKEFNRVEAEELNRRGLKEYDLGNVKRAVELWEKAVSLEPGNVKIKNNLNRAKDELGRKK